MTQIETKWLKNGADLNMAIQFRGRVVVVDDDRQMRSLLEDFLTSEGYVVRTFPLANEALHALAPGGELAKDREAGEIDVLISDVKMPQIDGLEFTSRLQVLRPEIPIILITAFGSIETAIEAMKRGAHHYVVKPFKLTEMAINVERAKEKQRLIRDNKALREEVQKSWSLGSIVGKSPGMKAVFDLVTRVSQVTSNVLVMGESGTGKELVARAIHEGGPRAKKPFIAINCSAIPEALLESELFGHAKGSFTGAIQKKLGLFEEAEGGTLFLDEIGDMNVQLQAKLLRVIQERKLRAVGDNQVKDIDVRIIAATHKDMKAAMKEGRFREDLFYRLSVIPIVIPPLRDRREDIPLLAEHFLKKFVAANNIKMSGFTKEAMSLLMSMRWEGNVRELENLIERAVVLSPGPMIQASDFPAVHVDLSEDAFVQSTTDFPALEQLEKRYIRAVLDKTGGRKDQAAQILGISRRTLYRKEREYGWVSSDPDSNDENELKN
jgi:DNA-binding NtrC family response regulator